MFAMIKNRKVKLLKETRMSLYQLFLWKEMKIHIQKITYTRNCNAILMETEIIQGKSMGKVQGINHQNANSILRKILIKKMFKL